MIRQLCQMLRQVLDFYLEPASSNAGAAGPVHNETPAAAASGRKPLKRDSKSYLEWTIEDWMEDPWDRRDVEWMRERWPGISDEMIISQLRQH